jgi:hypothetical protein
MHRLLFLILLPVCGLAQEEKKSATEEQVYAAYSTLPLVDSQYVFSEVVQLDSSYNREVLYKNAKLFFAHIFKTAQDVLQYDDHAEGKLIGKGSFQFSDKQCFLAKCTSETRTTNYTLEITCRDGRFKYRIFGILSDYTTEDSDKGRTNQSKTGTLTINQAYDRTQKGMTKKMERNLFVQTIEELNAIPMQIKKFMSQKPAKDDF